MSSIDKGTRARGTDGSLALLRCGASALVLGSLLVAGPAYAQIGQLDDTAGQTQNSDQAQAPETRIADQTDPTADTSAVDDAIVVTGIRQSLANAQNIKRNADTVVDAITAEDIGALPDRSVTEALQRVPGVAINRFAGSNDPDHFSVEGSGVVVRGLNFVRSEFNGRDTFSANSGRSLGFADVPSELLGSVEVYKNVTAEMIEGGLAGTVNLNTRVPFDDKGFQMAFSAEANYGDFAKKFTPVGSLLVSNTWDTDGGRFGLLGSVAYSRLKSRADGLQISNFQTRDGATVRNSNDDGDIVRTPLPGQAVAYAPIGPGYRTQDYDRDRFGIAIAGQWESTSRDMLLTAQFLRSKAGSKWGEHTFETAGDLSEYNTFPVGCGVADTPTNCDSPDFVDYEYDENGVFESGYITLPGTGWRSADSGQEGARVPTGGTQQQLSRRMVDQTTVTTDYGLNFKYTPNDRWSFNVDGQFVQATTDNLDVSVMGSTYADSEIDLTGDLPDTVLHRPFHVAASWAPNPTGVAGPGDAEYFGSPGSYFWRSAMDHIQQSEGEELAFKGDVSYDFQDDIPGLRRIKFGARYSDRDQTVRASTYNWGSLSEVWSGGGPPVWMDTTDANNIDFYEFDDFFRGQSNGPIGGWYYGGDLIGDYDNAVDFFQSIQQQSLDSGGITPSWVPLSERANVTTGTPFLPSEINTVSEATKAAYVMLSFGKDEPMFGGVTVDGNIGVRYVNTKSKSFGSLQLTDPLDIGSGESYADTCTVEFVDPDGPGPLPPQPTDLPAVCDLGPEGYAAAQQFSNGAAFPSIAVNKYDYFLPSLNIKFGLAEDLILRFGASKVLTRPDMGYIRNFVTIGTNTDVGFRFQADAGNPYLKPATAKTFDLGLEWYFARVGSLTGALFYKDIKGFFWSNVTEREITNNGVTQNVFFRGPANYEGNGSIKGFELAYQQTFDFLPGLLSGLGVNANYTYIKSKGIPNADLVNTAPEGEPRPPTTGRGNLPLEGLSKHNYNLTAFYEKGPVSLRASYSWRSKFLLTVRDVIFPYFPIYNDETGTLDATAFFSINDNLKIGVQAQNLNNEVTKTIQVFTAEGLEAPRSYFMNDRRFSFILRGNF